MVPTVTKRANSEDPEMKTQKTPEDPNPRKRKQRNPWRAALATLGSQTRKVPLILAFAVVFLAESPAEAVIAINADQVGGTILFTLSGTLNTGSLDAQTVESHFSHDIVEPQEHSGAPPGVITRVWFGTPGPSFVPVNVGRVANLTGPSFFGPGVGLDQPSNNTGSMFGFIKFTPNSDLGTLDFPLSYVSLSPLSASMSFTGTFASVGMTPGIYQWDWFNSSNNIQDSLVLKIGDGVPEPSAVMLIVLGLAALVWLRRKVVAEKRLSVSR